MNISFEQLPHAVNQLNEKLDNIERLLLKKNSELQETQDELLTVKDAANFLSLSVPTIYGLISKKELPVMKRSKRCYFSKVDLINYIKDGRKKTNAEIKASVSNLMIKKRG